MIGDVEQNKLKNVRCIHPQSVLQADGEMLGAHRRSNALRSQLAFVAAAS